LRPSFEGAHRHLPRFFSTGSTSIYFVPSWWSTDKTLEAALWTINVSAVFFITHYLFEMNSRAIFFGWDGQSMLAFLGERHRFSDTLFGVGSDPIIGLGNISYALNPSWFPSFLLSTTRSGELDAPLAFAIGATGLFAATVLCGRLNGFAIGPSIAAGWLLTLMTWQLFGMPAIVTHWFFFPCHAEVLAMSTIMVSAVLRLGEGSVRRSILLTVVIFLCLTYVLLAIPTSLILIVPIAGAFTAARFLLSEGRRERLTIILCWIGIGVAALVLGYFHYLAGLLSYTAAGQFPELSKRALTFYGGQVSLFLWTPIPSSIFSSERIMVGGGVIGSLVTIWLGSPQQRRLALGVLLAETGFIAVGASNYWLDYWFGPAIWYFELHLFPYFVLCLCFLLLAPLTIAWRQMLGWFSLMARQRLLRYANAAIALVLPLVIALKASAAGPIVRAESEKSDAFRLASPYPQPESAITRILKNEIKLAPDQEFRGRVAVMVGRIFPEERMWQRYSLVHYFAQFATGNLHDGPGLWQDDLPTLMEYNTLITPAYFAFVRAFLTDPSDIQYRNIIGTRHIDQRILKAVGVRFVITDLPIPDAALRARVPIAVSAEGRRLLGFSEHKLDGFDLFLYELEDVNLGQFSPTKIKLAADADEVLTTLSDGTLNLDQAVVVNEPVPAPQVRAKLELFAPSRDGYRVRASSTGTSTLLLPIEFSRCLKISDVRGATPLLFRADLLLTGVLFERQLDAWISFHTGPFRNARCRLDDLADNNRMDMRNAFRRLPAFGDMGQRF
jgi:TM2 domain-containing membrane protein YozV